MNSVRPVRPGVIPIVAVPGAAATAAPLYISETKIQPRSVHGWFATWRWTLVWLTQLLFYGLPWLTWNGRPAVLLDLASRRFYIFGMVLHPQDVIYLAALLIISAFGLFLFTAVAGRLWCGFACPQTVYTEIYMWVERRFEGDRQARLKLDAARVVGDQAGEEGRQAVRLARDRPVDRLHVRRLLHAGAHARRRGDVVRPRPVGDVLDRVLRLRDLRQRRLHARAGLQVHVPVCALPERDVRPRHPDHQLRRAARRAARLAGTRRRSGVGRQGRLHQLHAVRAGLPDRHRHPRGPAVRVHRLRRLHRRLQRRDGQDETIRAA